MADIEIIQGDCLEIMRGMSTGSFSLVITSPPYNLGNTSGGGFPLKGSPKGHYSTSAPLGSKRGGAGKWSGGALADGYGDCKDDMPHEEYVAWQKEVLTECWRLLTDDGAIFYNHKPRIMNGSLMTPFDYLPALPVRQVIIWARAGGVNFSPAFYVPTHEWIVIIAKPGFRLRDKAASGMGDVWMFPQRADPSHPAPFPIELPTRILKTTRPGDVLDPFAGSGTVGRACAKAGRRCTLIEIDPRYLPLIRRRVRDAETPLFSMHGTEAEGP